MIGTVVNVSEKGLKILFDDTAKPILLQPDQVMRLVVPTIVAARGRFVICYYSARDEHTVRSLGGPIIILLLCIRPKTGDQIVVADAATHLLGSVGVVLSFDSRTHLFAVKLDDDGGCFSNVDEPSGLGDEMIVQLREGQIIRLEQTLKTPRHSCQSQQPQPPRPGNLALI